jgi:tetratricopeptide (TPR) repeat protein
VTRALVALVALLGCASAVAFAEPAEDAAFREASRRAAAGDPGAIDAFEAAGAARPVTRWTDDAWAEAARLAERARDYERARRDLEQALAVATDPVFVRRLRGNLERIAGLTGNSQWTEVAARHDQLITQAASGDDPTAELEALEQLVRENPTYPRAPAVQWAIARGWDQEGEPDRARRFMRDALRAAPQAEQGVYRTAWIRMLIRHGELAAARSEIDKLVASSTRTTLERELATAHTRAKLRWAIRGLLLVLVGLAIFVIRRGTGSWRAAARKLARPPVEVIYFLPIAIVVGVVALTGNPIVAKAVVSIVVAGLAMAWLSGVVFGLAASRRRLLLATVLTMIAVIAMAYLVVDQLRLLDLLEETWRTGPTAR